MLVLKKNLTAMPSIFLVAFADSAYGASLFAGSAIYTFSTVDDVFSVSFRNDADGAGVCTSSAADATVIDNSWHNRSPLIL